MSNCSDDMIASKVVDRLAVTSCSGKYSRLALNPLSLFLLVLDCDDGVRYGELLVDRFVSEGEFLCTGVETVSRLRPSVWVLGLVGKRIVS